MAGILDSKSRIMDTVVTRIGRSQMASGDFRISMASFTDGATFYAADVVSGSDDASVRIYMEADSLPHDRITFRSDESGYLQASDAGLTLSVLGGRIVSGSASALTGSAASSAFETILSSSLDNFRMNLLITSADPLTDESDFVISPQAVFFTVSDTSPIADPSVATVSLDDVESLFQDKRLSHHINFMHLPPVNTDGSQLGEYPRLGQAEILSYGEIAAELADAESVVITFPETSRENNTVFQVFDVRDSSVIKMDIIDFGEFPGDSAQSSNKHVFFLGRLLSDGAGMDTYVNVFTAVFE